MHMFQFETAMSEMVLVAQRDAILLALVVQPFCLDHVTQWLCLLLQPLLHA